MESKITGNTMRNQYWRKKEKNYHFFIKRQNPNHLTIFDVEFDMFNRKTEQLFGYSKEKQFFSEDNFAKACKFLEENASSVKTDEFNTFYRLPILGIFEKYDEKKAKYIYNTEIPESEQKQFVIYEIIYPVRSIYHAEKNSHKKLFAKSDRQQNFEKYGRKGTKMSGCHLE